ncbi:ribonuclease HII [Patescibacteria group bacterium]|nr:MAG: ribonuclease HII [Patescibacteria group bacterium]
MDKSTFDLETRLLVDGYQLVIGVDEAGRGPLAGPVVAAAVAYKSSDFAVPVEQAKLFALIRDSKKLSHQQREKVFDFIHENFHVGVGSCDHHTIDRINILEASFLAMKKAVGALAHSMEREAQGNKDVMRYALCDMQTIVLVDGNKCIPNFSHEQRAIVGGDRIVKSISAASIIAKVTRDRMMLELHEQYPEYGLDQHKGYGTKFHMEMIEKFGPSKIHRRTFEPMPTYFKKHKK